MGLLSWTWPRPTYCMELCYLEKAITRLGFAGQWIRMVMECIRTVSYSVVLNGSPVQLFFPKYNSVEAGLYEPTSSYFVQKVCRSLYIKQPQMVGLLVFKWADMHQTSHIFSLRTTHYEILQGVI